jgi:hypothetical protein
MMKKDPDPRLTDPDADPEGQKHTYGMLRIRIHNTDSYNSQINARKSAMLNEIYLGIDDVDAI